MCIYTSNKKLTFLVLKGSNNLSTISFPSNNDKYVAVFILNNCLFYLFYFKFNLSNQFLIHLFLKRCMAKHLNTLIKYV